MSAEPTKIGKYRILSELGRGTSSRVYLGRDPFADRKVAIKVMLRDSQSDNAAGNRLERIFHNEAALAGRLIHPHIIEILDADVGAELAYIVMEYVDGRTLEHFCKVDTLMPFNNVVELAFKCALALDFASRKGIIHRDIKPANILMGNNGDIKLTDFGIALQSDGETTQLQGVGSPTYMSPEQIQEESLTYQTDIYSLGIVMYRLLTGKLPFVASNNTSLAYQIVNVQPVQPSVHRPDMPAALDRIVMKAIAKDVSQRYQTWNEFSADLGQVNKDLSVSTDTINETEKFSAIRNVRYFSDFADLEVWEMVRIATFRRVPAKEILVPEGKVCDSFFLIVSGEARVRKEGQSLSVLGDGDCFGEMPYFEERGPRTSSVVSITPMTIIEVNSTALRLASDACQKQFNRGFLRILFDRIDRLSKANQHLMQSMQSMRNKPQSTESKGPESRKPESKSTQSNGPESKKPEAMKPEAVKPEPVKPEAVKPEAVKPEAMKPQAVKPEPLDLKIEIPDYKKPEPVELKIEFPQSKPSESKKAESQGPKLVDPAAPKPAAARPEAAKPQAAKPEAQGPKLENPESMKTESKGLKLEDPEFKKPEAVKPESQGLKLEDPKSMKPEPVKPQSQDLKLEDPEAVKPGSTKPESHGLKLEDPEPKKPASMKPQSQGLELADPEPKKPVSEGLKLEDPETKKPASEGPKLEGPESTKPASQGLKLEVVDPNKPESKTAKSEQAESTAQTR